MKTQPINQKLTLFRGTSATGSMPDEASRSNSSARGARKGVGGLEPLPSRGKRNKQAVFNALAVICFFWLCGHCTIQAQNPTVLTESLSAQIVAEEEIPMPPELEPIDKI